jgi:hypothetical protein
LKSRKSKSGPSALLKLKPLATLTAFVISSMGCTTPPKPADLKFAYYGSSLNESLIPSTNGKSISCAAKEFDEMVCLNQTDFFEQCLMRRRAP